MQSYAIYTIFILVTVTFEDFPSTFQSTKVYSFSRLSTVFLRDYISEIVQQNDFEGNIT